MPRTPRRKTDTSDTENAPDRRGYPGVLAPDAGIAGIAAFTRAGFSDPGLVLNWTDIAGPDTAKLCIPLKLKDDVLTLKAEPAAAVFLQYETRQLTDRINTYLGRQIVRRLKFVQAPLMHREPPPPKRPEIPENVRPDDPVQAYQGPQTVRETLMALARARYTRPIMRRY